MSSAKGLEKQGGVLRLGSLQGKSLRKRVSVAPDKVRPDTKTTQCVGRSPIIDELTERVLTQSKREEKVEYKVYADEIKTIGNKIEGITSPDIRQALMDTLAGCVKGLLHKRASLKEHREIVQKLGQVVESSKNESEELSVQRMLNSKGLPCKTKRCVMLNTFLVSLRDVEHKLSDCITSKTDVREYVRLMEDLKQVHTEISGNQTLWLLIPELSEINRRCEFLQKKLNGLSMESELGVYYSQLKEQSYEYEEDGKFVICKPSVGHADFNEDAFQHSKEVTVVADGMGGELYSGGIARMVVSDLHQKLSALVERVSGRSMTVQNKKDIQLNMLDVCMLVSDFLAKKSLRLRSAATVSMEIRVPDAKGKVHRFLVFSGDCNAILKRPDGQQVLLNPLEYPGFKEVNIAPTDQLLCRKGADCRIKCLTVEKIDQLIAFGVKKVRNVTVTGGGFSSNPANTFKDRGLAMVYVSPEEGTTLLGSDGLTDRCSVEKVTHQTICQIRTNERTISRYLESDQFKTDQKNWITVLNVLQNKEKLDTLSKDEKKIVQTFKDQMKRWPKASEDSSMPEDVKKNVREFVQAMQWPNSGLIVKTLQKYLWKNHNGVSPNMSDTSELILTMAYDQFGVSRLSQSVLKWSDDITCVDTEVSQACASQDLETARSLIMVLSELTEATGDGLEEESIIERLRIVHNEYEKGKQRIADGNGYGWKVEEIRAFIAEKLLEAMNENDNVQTTILKILREKSSSPLQKFLKKLNLEMLSQGSVALQSVAKYGKDCYQELNKILARWISKGDTLKDKEIEEQVNEICLKYKEATSEIEEGVRGGTREDIRESVKETLDVVLNKHENVGRVMEEISRGQRGKETQRLLRESGLFESRIRAKRKESGALKKVSGADLDAQNEFYFRTVLGKAVDTTNF